MRNGYSFNSASVVVYLLSNFWIPKTKILTLGLLLFAHLAYSQCSVQIEEVHSDCYFNLQNNGSSFDVSVDISWTNAMNAAIEVMVGSQVQVYQTTTANGSATVSGFSLSNPGFGYTVMASTSNDAGACQDFSTLDAIACTPQCAGAPNALGGFVWHDDNANGMYDGESGQANVKIEVYDCEGVLIGTTYSNANGQWNMYGMTPGEQYRVEFSVQQIPGVGNSFASTENGTNVQFAEAGDCGVSAAFMSNLVSENCENPDNVGNAPCLENFNELDWSTYSNGAIPFPFPPYAKMVGNDKVYWSRNRDDETAYTHKVYHQPLGGAEAYYYLEMDADNTGNTDSKGVGVVFSFDRPVARLQFDLLDIDVTGTAVDQVKVEGFLGGMPVELSMADINAGLFVNALEANLFEGTTDVLDAGTNGNVHIEFPSPVDQVSITLSPTASAAANPDLQAIGIGNLYWCPNQVAVDPQCVRFFDWMNFQDNNAAPMPYTIGGMDISMETSDPAGIAMNDGFKVDNDNTPMGGQRGYWALSMDANEPGQYVETRVNFQRPVEQLSFAVIGVDGNMDTGAGFDFKDVVSVHGYLNGVEVPLNMVDIYTGTGMMGGAVSMVSPNRYEALSKVANSAADDGNVYISFPDKVDEIVVRLEAGSGVSNPAAQYVGLSDLSFCICNPSPIQLGNLVWRDDNENGIQEPCEPAIEQMDVSLYTAEGVLLAQTETDDNGNYSFTNSETPGENWLDEGQVQPDTEYYILFGNDSENPDNKFVVANNRVYRSTLYQIGEGSNPYMNDSDVYFDQVTNNMPGSMPDGLPYIYFTTGDGGAINSNLDAGFQEVYFDIALTKSLDTSLTAPPFVPGEQVAYTIMVYNQGLMNAESITIMDYIPTGLVLQSNDWNLTGSQATKIIQNLEAGDSLELSIIFNIQPSFSGTSITNNAEIGRSDNSVNMADEDSTPDYNMNNDGPDEDDFDSVTINIAPALVFDLSLEKTLNGNGPFNPGDNISFTIEVANEGILPAEDVQISDYIPAGLILNDSDWTESNGVATLNTPISAIGTGNSASVTIDFTIHPNFAGSSITNSAEIKSFYNNPWTDDQDSSPDNEADGEDDMDEAVVNVVPAPFDLSLEKTVVTPGPFSPGSLVTYEITVTNEGGTAASDIVIHDYVPNGLIYSGNQWEIANNIARYESISNLAPGASTTVSISFIIDPNFLGASLTNKAEIEQVGGNPADVDSTPGNGSDQEDDDDKATISVQQQAQIFDLSLSKEVNSVATPGPYQAGDFVSFTITVTNEGNVTATNVQVADYVAPGLLLADVDWITYNNLAILALPISSIEPGESESVSIDFYIDDNYLLNQIENFAEIYSAFNNMGIDDLDSSPGNGINNGEDDQDVAYLSVESTTDNFDLSLDKAINTNATPGPYYAGGQITFKLTVTNEGSMTADVVQVGDNVPQGLILNDPNWTLVPGGAILVNPITGLAPGQSSTVNITFNIDDNFTGTTITNFAEIVAATNIMDMPDEDSTPNNGVYSEDDTDAAQFSIPQNFDLAFSKTVATPGPYLPGTQVTFNLTVYNQGSVTATNIQLYDYYPTTLMSLSDPDWQPVNGNIVQLQNTIASLAPGASTVVPITFTIKPQVACGAVISNCGEIASANNALGLNDSDSVFANGSHNEDDDDAVDIVVGCVQEFDLALEKSVNTSLTPGPFTPGSTVSFNIEVTNEGEVAAQNIEIEDYIPTGLILIDPNWSAVGGIASLNNPIASLAPGATTTVSISFAISPAFAGSTLNNYAEIVDADNIPGLNDIDSTPGNAGSGPNEDDYDNAIISVVQQQFDLALSKSVNTNLTPGPFQPGSTVTFKIDIFNQGVVTAQNIQLREYIPLGLVLADNNWNSVGSVAELNVPIASLAPGAMTSVNVSFTISPAFTGTSLTNFAEIGSAFNAPGLDDLDSTPGNGSAGANEDDYDGASISVQQTGFDLALDKALLSSGPFQPGSTVTFRLTLTNQGSLAAQTVTLRDYMPLGLILNDANWTANGSTAIFNNTITNLQPGASTTADITFTISPSFVGTTITNFAEIGTATNIQGLPDDDSTPGNGSAGSGEDDFDSASLSVSQQQFDLSLNKSLNTSVTPGPFTPGSTVTFAISVTNQGSLSAQNLVLRDYIPLGLTLADNNWTMNGSTAVLNTPIASLAPGNTVTRNITFTISPSFTGTLITNFAEVGSVTNTLGVGDIDSTPGNGSAGAGEDDYDGATISISSAQVFDLALVKSLNSGITSGPFQPGNLVTFAITVSNQGNVTAQNISIKDYIPTGLILADINWSQLGSTALLNTPIASLAPGASTTVNITFTIDPSFSGLNITNYAEINSVSNGSGLNDVDSTPNNGFAGPTEDDLDSAVISILNQEFDLALNKTVAASTPGPYAPGAMVTYELTIINQGDVTAQNVQLRDFIPQGLILVDSDWTQAGGVATYNNNIASIAAGGFFTVAVDFVIDQNFQGTSIVNFAEILGASNTLALPDSDSTPGNGSVGAGEDDYDSAVIAISTEVDPGFDLALTKVVNTSATPGPFSPGSAVTFEITVINQGDFDAFNVEITDYIPAGMILNDVNWAQSGNTAVRIIPGPIAASGGTQTINITFQVDPAYSGAAITNVAEISFADDDTNLANTPPVDIDSQYDDNPTNDAGGLANSPSDNAINGNGMGAPGSGVAALDEDDHDPAMIVLDNCSGLSAGSNGFLQICLTCNPASVEVDLFAALGGNPSLGGMWSDNSGSGVNLMDPANVDITNLSPGTYFYTYTVGGQGVCPPSSATVELEIQNVTTYACNDQVNLVFGIDNCEREVTPDMILEGSDDCMGSFEVVIIDEFGQNIGNTVTGAQVGQLVEAFVVDPYCGILCSGDVLVIDQTPPSLICPTQSVDLLCNDLDSVLNNPASLLITGEPQVFDNCADFVDVTFTDFVPAVSDCADKLISRTFTATDPAGNTTSCTQNIIFRVAGGNDVIAPPLNVNLECDDVFPVDANGNPHPSVTGYPLLDGYFDDYPLSQSICGAGASYQDAPPIVICEGTVKIVRTWTVLAWCDPVNGLLNFDQIIKVGDTTGPDVTCPNVDYDGDGQIDPLVFSTSPYDCSATFSAPLPQVSDNCSGWEVTTDIMTEVITPIFNQFNQLIGYDTSLVSIATILPNDPTRIVSDIPVGCYLFRYTVADDCDNITIEDCEFCVVDDIEPTAVCEDFLNISLGGDGYGLVFAEDIDAGSNDNCALDTLLVRRLYEVDPISCDSVTPYYSEWANFVDFTCCDVNTNVTIELQAIDIYGNSNICWLEVLIEDKVDPYCYAPNNTSISCVDLPAGFDPLDTLTLQGLFGNATAQDDCGPVSTMELDPIVNLDNCGFGTIIRRFKAVDAQGNESNNSCQQIITITEEFNYSIQFPADVEADCVDPDADSLFIESLGCEDLFVSVTDEIFSPLPGEAVCYKIFRTYKVINWCEWDGISDPIEIGRDEDCDGEPGDEDVWLVRRPNGAFIDRDNDQANTIPAFGTKGLSCDGSSNPTGYWRTTPSVGFWEYTQIIKVVDNTAPEIVFSQPDPFCSIDQVNCLAAVQYPFVVVEDCSPNDLTVEVFLDANADGTIDQNLTNTGAVTGTYPNYTISGDFPIGNHEFIVQASDQCGNNTASESLPFEVVDCIAPTFTCLNGITFNIVELPPNTDINGDGIIDFAGAGIWANDFTINETDCSDDTIAFSINLVGDQPDMNQTSLYFTCEDTGTIAIEVYVWDSAYNPYAVQPDGTIGGPNYDFCQTYVLIQDNMGLCGPGPGPMMAGLIARENDDSVEGVEVSLSGQMNMMMMTDVTGTYEFDDLETGYDYSITPYLDANHRNGVSTFDMLMIQQHLLGVTPLGSPYKMIAADVNRSNSVTTLDLIQIQRVILGIDLEFTNNTSWRFIDADHVFPVPSNPWFTTIPEAVSVNNLNVDAMANDFIAVKIGDVNYSAQTTSLMQIEDRSFDGIMSLKAPAKTVSYGELVAVPISIEELEAIRGYQFTMEFDDTVLELEEVEYGLADELSLGLHALDQGYITASWYGIKADAASDELFTLYFRAKRNAELQDLLWISSRATEAEAYSTQGELLDVAIDFGTGESSSVERFALYQNEPNPFSSITNIGFHLPTSGAAQISIYSLDGRLIKTYRDNYSAGYNQLQVNRHELPASGVLYYRLQMGDKTATKKMIVVE
jgi:uncharacterized repeat protein (TIGR01451 family)